MGRINGINSDYILGPDGIIEVPHTPGTLDLKLFLCPYDQPNALQETSGTCTGTEAACPNAGPKTGHALVHLNETSGISLQTDGGTTLRVHQNSGPDAGKISFSPAAAIVKVNGAIELVAGGHTITITPSATGISFQHSNGAQVVFKPTGDLDLITKNNTGTVNIKGNLVVTGTVTRQGQII